ncbi:putative photosynthetic complex assembly protein PuhE [Sphingomonas sp. ASV193]|uniref:putative photosynthetic complex assembly protein PuhE n=1 Tax=Sphingomonas sp. ASV193 TaxID=3144405 RepID=UPI0032E8C159
MVSWSGHVLPVLVTIAIWFVATGLVAWIDHRDRETFPRSLALAGAAGIAGLVVIFVSMRVASIPAVYAAFGGALMVWSWLEVAFLTGAVAGSRREPLDPLARGWRRFSQAVAAMIHHELALALTALMLISLSWTAPNQVAAMTFALLWAMRLSTKLNIYRGVPNMSAEMLPPQLAYLKSYFGPRRMSGWLAGSILAAIAIAAWLAEAAMSAAPGSAGAVGASLLFALAALGALEHLFLALPVRDGALWGWALPSRTIIRGEG